MKDPTFKADFEFLEKRFPGKDVNFQSSTADEQRWIVVAASDTDPGEVFVYDRATKKVTPAVQGAREACSAISSRR